MASGPSRDLSELLFARLKVGVLKTLPVWVRSDDSVHLTISASDTMQFSRSVVSNFCDPMDCSMPGFPTLHHLPELAQTHVH